MFDFLLGKKSRQAMKFIYQKKCWANTMRGFCIGNVGSIEDTGRNRRGSVHNCHQLGRPRGHATLGRGVFHCVCTVRGDDFLAISVLYYSRFFVFKIKISIFMFSRGILLISLHSIE